MYLMKRACRSIFLIDYLYRQQPKWSNDLYFVALARESLALRAAHADGVAIADSVTVEAELGFIARKDRLHEPPIASAMGVMAEVWPSEAQTMDGAKLLE